MVRLSICFVVHRHFGHIKLLSTICLFVIFSNYELKKFGGTGCQTNTDDNCQSTSSMYILQHTSWSCAVPTAD